jgi:hypothetical protein
MSAFPLGAPWEEHLGTLTPIEQPSPGGLTYKRDDLWAPLGPGGINGFKVRQGLWLLQRALGRGRVEGVVFAGSVKSTQHANVATLARYFGLPSLHVLGATSPATCLQHPTLAVAAAMGAEFDFIKVAYNPAIQKRARELLAERPSWVGIEYGVGLDHRTCSAEELFGYHLVAAPQVRNLPAETRDLLVPAGSCHAATSILFGLANEGRSDLAVHLVGLGNARTEWLQERLGLLGLTLRWGPWEKDQPQPGTLTRGDWKLDVFFHDLIGDGFTTYQERYPAVADGIEFHPTYEAKIVRWLHERATRLIRPSTVFWVVGAEPRLDVMQQWAAAL